MRALGFHLDKTFKMENILYFIFLFFEKGGEKEEREVLHRGAVSHEKTFMNHEYYHSLDYAHTFIGVHMCTYVKTY